ncbi:uncharacterized protein LOC107370820 [Tetranychus urticae]|nr:uncharacterized protein LOC107370820 [Tetranychus urticae]
MDYVINLCNMLDYFGIKDHLVQDCINYFNDNFSLKHLPVVMPQVIPVSKLIDSSRLNAFICRYFLKIANTNVWLDYPVETIEYMCSLDLMIHSEYQVFDAIMKWIKAKADSRKCYIERLLKLIRWCHLEDKDLSKIRENELIGSFNSTPEICAHDESNCNCINDRTKQGCFVLIEEWLDDKDLRVKVLDGNFGLLINQVVRLDEFMPLILLQDEHVSDISFDSGRQMIRIDWKQKKYCMLDLTAYKSYYQIYRSIFEDQEGLKFHSVITKPDQSNSDLMYELSLLEAAEKFILVRNGLYRFKCWENPSIADIKNQSECYGQKQCTYLATVQDNNVYALTRNLDFFRFNISKCEFNRIGFRKDKFKFVNLLLTSKQANDDRVILIDKTTKDVLCFNVSTQEWKSIDQIIDCKSNSSEDSKEPNVLKTFTFGFISLDSINLCLEQN